MLGGISVGMGDAFVSVVKCCNKSGRMLLIVAAKLFTSIRKDKLSHQRRGLLLPFFSAIPPEGYIDEGYSFMLRQGMF